MTKNLFNYHGNYFVWRRTNSRKYEVALAFPNGNRAQAWIRTTRKMLEKHYGALIPLNSKNQYC